MQLSIKIYPDKPSYKDLKVTGLDGSNTLAVGFRYAVTLVSREWLPNLVGQTVCVTIGTPKAPPAQKRVIKGFITAMACKLPSASQEDEETTAESEQNEDDYTFVITIEPWPKAFSQTKNTAVFSKQKIGDIIKTIVEGYYQSAKKLAMKVHNRCGSDDKVTYPSLTQLKQSDADFITYLMARSGVFFYFDTEGDIVIHADITKAAAKAKTQTLKEDAMVNKLIDMDALHADEFTGCEFELPRAKWYESKQTLKNKTPWLKQPSQQQTCTQGFFPSNSEQQLKNFLEQRKCAQETHQQVVTLQVMSTPDGKNALPLNGFAVTGKIKPSVSKQQSLPKTLVVIAETIIVSARVEDNRHTVRTVSLDGKTPQALNPMLLQSAFPNVVGLYEGTVDKAPKKEGPFIQLTACIDWAADNQAKPAKNNNSKQPVTEHHYPTWFGSLNVSHYLAPTKQDTVKIVCLDGNPELPIVRAVSCNEKTVPSYSKARDGNTLADVQGLNVGRVTPGKATPVGITWTGNKDLHVQAEKYEVVAKEASFHRAAQVKTNVAKKLSANTATLFIEAGEQVTLAVGNNELVVTPNKVTLNGKTVTLNGVSPAQLKQKLMPIPPKLPMILDPSKPTPEQFVGGKIVVPG